MLGTGTYADLRIRIASVMNKDDHHLRHHLRRQLVLFRNKTSRRKLRKQKRLRRRARDDRNKEKDFTLAFLLSFTQLSYPSQIDGCMLSTSIHPAAINSPRPTLRKDLSWRLERKRHRTRPQTLFSPPGLNGYHIFIPPRFRAFG